MDNDFKVLLQAVIDASGVGKSSIDEVQKVLNKYHLNLTADLNRAELIKTVRHIVPELEKELKKITGIDIQIGDDALMRGIRQYEKDIADFTKKVNKIQIQIDDGTYDAKIADMVAKTEQWTDASGKARISVKELNDAYTNLTNAKTDNKKIEAARKLEEAFKHAGNEVRRMNAELAKDSQVQNFHQKVQAFYDKNTAAHIKWGKELKQMLADTTAGSKVTNSQLESMQSRFLGIGDAARQAGKLGLSFFDKLKQGMAQFTMWTSATAIVMKAVQVGKDMVKNVKEIDTAMTSLYKVTDETSSRYNKFLDSASDKAKELGRSVSSLVEQTAEWAKRGYSLAESEELAKTSSIYANVGEVEDETAVSDITTAMKAFNIEAKESITIVDKLNNLGNKYATSSADLGEGLSHSASAMALAGTSIEKTLAMITGGAEITQDAGEFGTALKIGSMRIRSMKGKLEELGEEVDDSISSVSKVQTQILNLTSGAGIGTGVNIFDENNNFRDYYDIMLDISEVYDKLSSTNKSTLLELLFGKNRGNQGAALIQAFQSGQVQKAYTDAVDSVGSAMQEQERWLESLEADFASLYRNIQLGHI